MLGARIEPVSVPKALDIASVQFDLAASATESNPLCLFARGDGMPTLVEYLPDGSKRELTRIQGEWHELGAVE